MTSLYTGICSGVLFPLHERLKSHTSVAMRRELEQSQWASSEALADLQLRRLQEFLRVVEREVPYYAEQFARLGVGANDIRDLKHLQRLPLLTKALIRANTEKLKSRQAGRLVRYNTGGSTGEPLVFYMGMGRISHDVAAKWRATRWWEVDVGDVEVVLWGSPVELGKQDRIKALRDRVLRSYLLPAFAMTEQNMRDYLSGMSAKRPRMLFGYASALALLARFAESEGRDMTRLGIKVAFTTGETLYPDQRAIIQKVFAAPVANGYGSRDAGFIAHECPQGAMHLSAEHIIVELLDPSGRWVAPGETGEIVVTHLATGDFPFVRYRTGDMATAGRNACACGRGLPVLADVQGRSTDFVHTRAGNTLHALALIYEVRDKPGVKAFKFVQAEDLSLELLLVAGPELTEAAEQAIRTGVLRRMGADSAFAIRRVTDIPPEKSGKYRYVVSVASASTRAR